MRAPKILLLVVVLLGSVPSWTWAGSGGGELIANAEQYEATLRRDLGKLRMRHNIERLARMWSAAKKRAKGDDRRIALEGEARAWKLLAHWSGRSDDLARAESLAKAAKKESPGKGSRDVEGTERASSERNKRASDRVTSDRIERASSDRIERATSDRTDRASLDRSATSDRTERALSDRPESAAVTKTIWLKGAELSQDDPSALRLSLSSDEVRVRRGVIPECRGRNCPKDARPRVTFDLMDVRLASGAPTSVRVGSAQVDRARIAQFRDDVVRIVVDLEPGAGTEVVRWDAASVAVVLAPPEPSSADADRAIAEVTAASGERDAPEPAAKDDDKRPEAHAVMEEIRRVAEQIAAATQPAEPAEATGHGGLREKKVLGAAELKPALPSTVDRSELVDDGHIHAEAEGDNDDAHESNEVSPSTQLAVLNDVDSADLLAIRKVVIDAGHGGRDRGAKGVGGVLEKDVNLGIALKLGEELKTKLGLKVVYTRTRDQFLSLEKRARIANASGADLFISVHSNAHRSKRVRGIETYYLNTTSDRYSARLARRENTGVDEQGEELEPPAGMEATEGQLPAGALGQDLRLILADLAMRSASSESKRIAALVQGSMVNRLRLKHDHVRDLGVKHALFYVLLGARMPSILIESGFITHPKEGKRLGEEKYQADLAAAMAQGLKRYVDARHAMKRRDDDSSLASVRR